MKERVWCIGDIHGCFKTFQKLISRIPESEEIYLVGDFIDRGPYSKELIEFLIENKHRIKPILGNHEQFMIYSHIEMKNSVFKNWLKNGGDKTLESYFDNEGNFEEEIFLKHKSFLHNLPRFRFLKFENYKDLLISHSLMINIWKGEDAEYSNRIVEDSQWKHYPNLQLFCPYENENVFNVFGHTIYDKPFINEHLACIDIGIVAKRQLCAFSYPDKQVLIERNVLDL